jgi:hypothetical protein
MPCQSQVACQVFTCALFVNATSDDAVGCRDATRIATVTDVVKGGSF